jgi:hypothetical protein
MASLGASAITQSDAEREHRFELFLEGKTATAEPDRPTLEQACERLVEQKLLALEAGPDFPTPGSFRDAALEELGEVRKRYANQEAYLSALRTLAMSEEEVLDRLAQQQWIVKIVDQRLRPAATPEASEIEAYYRETFVPEYARRSAAPPPPLAEVESQVREILVQKKTNELLASWLEELKSSHQVRFHDF